MLKFSEMVVKYRLYIIMMTVLVTAFFAYQLKDAKVNSDILTYLKPDDPAVILFNRIGEEYAGTTLTIVGIEDKVFTQRYLKKELNN